MPPSDRALAHFTQHGWYVARRLLDPVLVNTLRERALAFYAGRIEFQEPLPLPHYLNWDKTQQQEKLRTNEYIVQQDPVFAALLNGPIGAMSARLCGSGVRLWISSLITKMPQDSNEINGETSVGWHADIAYWPSCCSQNMITAWVPLTSCDRRKGALQYLDGSHNWPGDFATELRSQRSFRTYSELDADVIQRHGHVARIISPRFITGDVSFHHCRLLHRSAANITHSPRIAVSLHLQDALNEFRPGASRHVNDLLARKRVDGYPDYSDLKWFPTLDSGSGS